MKRVVNILIASVGGQGGLTLSRIIARAAILEGYSVKTAETLGMAQRYGSVMGLIRVGSSVKSPLFDPGEADYILGLELTETLRRLHYVSSSGLVIVADEYKPSYTQSVTHPSLKTEDIILEIKSLWPRTIIVPARKLAEKAGSVRALNVVILGAFNAISNLLSTGSIKTAIREVLTEQAALTSIKAYELGYSYSQQAL